MVAAERPSMPSKLPDSQCELWMRIYEKGMPADPMIDDRLTEVRMKWREVVQGGNRTKLGKVRQRLAAVGEVDEVSGGC